MIITKEKLEELRQRWEVMPGTVSQETGLSMIETIEALYKVAEAASTYRIFKKDLKNLVLASSGQCPSPLVSKGGRVSFTDEDLTRFKADLDKASNLDDLGNFPKDKFAALLARLEAAEKVILEASTHCPVCGDETGSATWREALEAWCKAAGK